MITHMGPETHTGLWRSDADQLIHWRWGSVAYDLILNVAEKDRRSSVIRQANVEKADDFVAKSRTILLYQHLNLLVCSDLLKDVLR